VLSSDSLTIAQFPLIQTSRPVHNKNLDLAEKANTESWGYLGLL
jgi:hypothetical protein